MADEKPRGFSAPHLSSDGKIDREYVTQWLEAHWTNSKTCPICGSSNWAPSDLLANIPAGPPGLAISPNSYPSLLVLCTVCGYSVLFNAFVVGLVTLTPPGSEEKQEHGGP